MTILCRGSVPPFDTGMTQFQRHMDRVEKYRPHTLQDVVSHSDITNTSWVWIIESGTTFKLTTFSLVQQFLHKGRLPHLLFYGPPGTGKTSMILAMARQMYGDEYRQHIIEVLFKLPTIEARAPKMVWGSLMPPMIVALTWWESGSETLRILGVCSKSKISLWPTLGSVS